MLGSHIVDGFGRKHKVKVTSNGQLVVSPLSYDDTVFQEMDVTATAYNFYGPMNGHQFVITGVVAFADKDINDNSDTTIEIYEATSASTTTVTKTLIKFGMGKLTSIPIMPLNLLVTEGVWINAKTDDDDIHMTIMGHYITKVE